MRKTLVVSLVLALAVALTATAVTVAGDRGDSSNSRSAVSAKKTRHASARHGGHGAAMRVQVLRSLADRLGVTPRELRAAVRGIDRAEARSKFRSGDLAGLKADLA